MKLQPVDQLSVHYHRGQGDRLLVGRLAFEGASAVFQYDVEFRRLGLELSPFFLPVEEEGLQKARPDRFEGLFGLFDDSLPDGWGRLLLDRYIEKSAGPVARLTPLDRLAWVGAHAVGALSYEPEHNIDTGPGLLDLHALGQEARRVLDDKASDALGRLLELGGSPQGARPKALVLVSKDGEHVVSGLDHREGFDPYLVKFPSKSDPGKSSGPIELAYNRMARAAGIDVPDARLLGANRRHPGYFAIKRFDRRGPERLHTHTFSGLANLPPGVTFTSYDELLKLTRKLTADARAVKELFRRAVFNVYAHNRDDHARNFAFLMEPNGSWALAPAYDLTFSEGPGGEHAMTIAGEGRAPGLAHLLALAQAQGLKKADVDEIIDAVAAACGSWSKHARATLVPKPERDRISAALRSSRPR